MAYSYVYILASKRNGTLYVGVTSDLIKRVYEHRNEVVAGFTKKHKVHLLVYFAQFEDIEYAFRREKEIKHWRRDWKLKTIEENNPKWEDLYDGLLGERI